MQKLLLSKGFYARDTAEVATELLGKVLVRRLDGVTTRSRIVETEAYFANGDPASHAARGETKRNAVMFGPPGRAYVYLNYGLHYLLNFVTEKEGVAGAVLIRAVEPINGIELLQKNRPVADVIELTNGPAKLTQALAVDRRHNGIVLDTPDLGVEEINDNGFNVVSATRIGISVGSDLMYRYYIEGNRFVSRK